MEVIWWNILVGLSLVCNSINVTAVQHTITTKADTIKESNHLEKCILMVSNASVSKFRHTVFYGEDSFAYLKLKPGKDVGLVGDKLIVGPDVWVWTYYGKDGGLEILKWPIEYDIWSMGLLGVYVVEEPIEVDLLKANDSVDCSNLHVGNATDDEIISNALVRLADEMNHVTHSETYGPSFFCHLNRKYISPEFLYILCKHIVCPLEALEYECCNNLFMTTIQQRKVSCKGRIFDYDPISWILPTFISVVLFGFYPMLLLYLAHIFCDDHDDDPSSRQLYLVAGNVATSTESPLIKDFVFLNEHKYVTLMNTLASPIAFCVSSLNNRASSFCSSVVKRLIRCTLPFLSLIFIGTQLLLDYKYLRTVVRSSLLSGVPLGFRSMSAGYEESKLNFLPLLGGPYVAVATYMLIACILISLPDTISSTLLLGIPNNDARESISPLILRLQSVLKFGSVKRRNRQGYGRLLSVLQAQFFMLINIKYWKYVFGVQCDRWANVCQRKVFYILTPFYLLFCFIEGFLAIIFNGYPILSFAIIIIKAYCGRLLNSRVDRFQICRLIGFASTLIVVLAVLYFLFMFFTIFMDACLFVTRIVIFTFTGIVVHPKVAYGYMIFFCTVVYYIAQCVNDFTASYQTLLSETISVCDTLQRANDIPQLVVKHNGIKGVQKQLFEHVIETHRPRRKQAFLSLLKVGIILTVLGLSVNVLIETDGFKELHVVMHVATALFICALPQIAKTMCKGRTGRYRQKKDRRELAHTIKTFQGRVDSSDDEMNGELYA